MSKKFELWLGFSKGIEDKKIMSFEIFDERLEDYLINAILNNLSYEMNDLDVDYENVCTFNISEVY